MISENKVLVELNRVISTFADRKHIMRQVERKIPLWNYAQLIWLEEQRYTIQFVIEVEDTCDLSKSSFEHIVVYLVLSEEEAVHFQLVWK
jgi:hypothetical protein